MSEFIAFAQELALDVGEIMQAERQRRLRIEIKPDGTFVTDIDVTISEMTIDSSYAGQITGQ